MNQNETWIHDESFTHEGAFDIYVVNSEGENDPKIAKVWGDEWRAELIAVAPKLLRTLIDIAEIWNNGGTMNEVMREVQPVLNEVGKES